MGKKYYTHSHLQTPQQEKKKNLIRYSGYTLFLLGFCLMVYYSAPVLLWKILYEPTYASVISPLAEDPFANNSMSYFLQNSFASIAETTNTNNENWFLGYSFKKPTNTPRIESYTLSIPKIGIDHAVVSTVDSELDRHLVQYWGTPVPPMQGNTVIFGHSTLPQLYNPTNYKTIFANILQVKPNDTINVTIDKKTYTYQVTDISITTPDDISVLEQDTTGNYLTIITCTPPGTTWKRLIIKSKLISA